MPQIYSQLFNPQFFTHFRLISDKIHKVFCAAAYDGSNEGTGAGMPTNLPTAATGSMTEVITDYNTYVNKKLVTFLDMTNAA